MGKSYTIHCVGIPNGLDMSRLELCQEQYRWGKQGIPIEYWVSQTKVGDKILKLDGFGNYKTTSQLIDEGIISYVWLVTCPICKGDGHNGQYFCPVCNGSGICKKGNEKHWQPWQIESMLAKMSHYLLIGDE